MYAAYIAGVSFTKSYVGYIHAVAHSLGGQYNISHGLANAVLMPIVLDNYGRKKPLYPVPKLMNKKQLEKFYYQVADWSKS